MKTLLRLALSISIAPLFCSCAVMQLKRQVVKLEQRGAATIVISSIRPGSANTYALAWTRGAGGKLESVGFQRVSDAGIASFSLLTNHVYGIAAFTDEDGSGKYDAGEPLAFVENVRPSHFGDPKARSLVLPLELTRAHGEPPRAVLEVPKENHTLGSVLRVSLAEVVPLDDPRFRKECGAAGMWRPLEFLSETSLGIYFTEPYDPNRIPVLFVHGLGGSPRTFDYMMKHFDHTRYQLWFYHYPSGLRLSRLGSAMANGMEILHQRYGFKECHVVAFSLGGLVSAGSIRERQMAQRTNFVTRLVTISTPFGGHGAAQLCVRGLDKPVPSWIDVAPQSEFLRELVRAPMPPGTRYDLIYGDKGRSDGVVSVASQLEPHNREKASSVTSFPFRHGEILSQPVVVNHVLECLRN
jgi:pimeloyl-ACP methyl ester carboxylesterase